MYRFISALIVCGLCCGCGEGSSDTPETSSVTGKVTLDDTPLEGATVMFAPKAGGRTSIGTTDNNGHYELNYSISTKGAVPGAYTVTIRTATTTSGEDGNDIEVPEKLPPKYHDKSELTADVAEGENTIDFPLKSKE